jgi:hypothetical protein
MPEEHESLSVEPVAPSLKESGRQQPWHLVDGNQLQVEGKGGLHRLHLDIFHSYHASRKDLEALDRDLKVADVYLPEGRGWTDSILRIYQQVSAHQVRPDKALALLGISPGNTPHHGAFAESLKLIWKHRVPVAFADVPRGHLLDLALKTAFGRMSRSVIDVMNHRSSYPDYDAFVQQFALLLMRYYEMEGKREEYIMDHIPSAVRRSLQDYPKLRRRRDLKVLLSLGALHTAPYIHLKKLGVDVKRSFSRQPFIFPHGAQAGRTVLLGSGKPDDELVARAALEMMCDVAPMPFRQLTSDYFKAILAQRRLIDRLDSNEIKELIEAVLEGGDFRQSFMAKLADKKIVLPTTERQLDRFVDIPGRKVVGVGGRTGTARKRKRRSRKRHPPARPARG